jgi:hypothetical protein
MVMFHSSSINVDLLPTRLAMHRLLVIRSKEHMHPHIACKLSAVSLC